MLARLRSLDPPQPIWQILFYRVGYWLLHAIFSLVFRARFFGRANIPAAGGLLIIANHQSHLDPPLVGVGIRRRNMAAIAREGLFRSFPLGLLLRAVGCIPIKEGSGDAGAMRTAIQQLKRGRLVVIFPEGSRSPDGRLHDFKRGVWILMMRAGVPILPAAVDGCFDAWPRQRTLPHVLGRRVGVNFGLPIPFADLKALGPEQGLAMLAAEVETLRANLGSRLHAEPPR